MQKAILAAGCFWGVQSVFDQTPGVLKTTVGYTGGDFVNPIYEQVCSKKTGHAEGLKIEFDESKISYQEILKIFWENHNPTELNRQGPDIGEQYRSAIFYLNENQKLIAEKSKLEKDKSGEFSKQVVTEITKAKTFYPDADYHQKYFQQRGIISHCNL